MPAKARSKAETLEERARRVLKVAQELAALEPDWSTFFREIKGVGGAIDRAFPDDESAREFELTPEFAEIQQLLAKMRGAKTIHHPQKVITVRIPARLHEVLQSQAYQRKISMNQLCVATLLEALDDHTTKSA